MFSSVWDIMMRLSKPQPHANFEVASFSRFRNIIGNPKNLGGSLSQGHADFSSECDFIIGLDKTQPRANYEVAIFSHCVNIQGEPPNFGELS